MPDADVYKGTKKVGSLRRTLSGIEFTSGSFALKARSDQGALLAPEEFLATHLPVSVDPVESPELPPFFLNLLPEGARLRLLLENSKAKDDSLSLLLKVGWDTIGDIAVVPKGAPPPSGPVSVVPTHLSEVNFWELFSEGVEARADMSVPGVQEKISSSTVAFGVRTSDIPSAILKLNPMQFPNLVRNEEFFLRMAKGCGLEVNRAKLVQDRDGNEGLLIDRFDRIKVGKAIHKLHQEDGCQLLNAVPAAKYDATMRDLADVVSKVCSAPTVEIERLIALYAFSYIIGNGDLHAKNISVLWTDVVRLSPAYDLLSTFPYPGLDRHMALKLDGKDDNFRMADFVGFGLRYGVSERATRSTLTKLAAKASPWLNRLEEIGFDSKTTQKLRLKISSRIERLLR